MSERVLRLKQNLVGRDFVVGDVHGAFGLVIDAMEAVAFDVTRDRLILLGDLIDRGAGSVHCLDFLELPFVHSVRGNHEDMIRELSVPDLMILGAANFQGMGWLKDLEPRQIERIHRKLGTLPIAIEMETELGTVGFVHADVPAGMSWSEFTQCLEAGNRDVKRIALEGRERIRAGNVSGVERVSRVYVGHSIRWNGPQRYGNVFAIDTGAVFGEISAKKPADERKGALTMMDVVAADLESLQRRPGLPLINLVLNEVPDEVQTARNTQRLAA